MKHLTDEQYLRILHDNEERGNLKDKISFMRQWDVIRTTINPNAKWYNVEESKEVIKGNDND